MSLQTAPSVNVEQPTPRPRAASRPVYRSPLPPPAAPPPALPPLPTSNRFSINQTQGFTNTHSSHSSISSLTNGADPSASSGSQPPTPSTYGGYPVSRHSPPTENGSLDQEQAARVRRQSLLESLRAGEEDGGITSFASMSKSTSDRSLTGSLRQQGNHLEGLRERPESGGVLSSNGFDSPVRKSEDTERGMEVLSRTPLQPGFIMDSPINPAIPSSVHNDDFSPRPSSARASIDSARSNDSRGSRLGRVIKAAISPRTSIDEPHPNPNLIPSVPHPPPRSAVPNTASSVATARERESLVSPRTITGSSGALLISSADDKPFRISATDEGTISQRRRGPPSLNENTFVPPSSATSMSRDSSAQSSTYPSSDSTLRAETLPIQRSSSAEPCSPPAGSRTTTEFGVGAGISGGASTSGGAGGASQSRGSSIFSSTRLRALSQPGRRPSPSSVAGSGEPPRPAAPPVPRAISRKASFPSSQQPISGLPPTSSPSPFAMGRAPSSSSTTPHNRLNPPPSLTMHRSISSSSSTLAPRTANSNSNGAGLAPSQSILLAAGKLHTGIHSPQPPLAPQEILHRPFHLMGLLRLTMYDAGAYLTRKLFVGSEVWSQGGSKLLHLDTKIHVLQGLSFHLEALESVGASLLPVSKEEGGEGGGGGVMRNGKGGKNAPSAVQVGVEFARMLEEFEGVMDLGRTTLEKKVGSLGPMKPKARGAVSSSSDPSLSRRERR